MFASVCACCREIPASPLCAVITLALGIAATTAIFSVVYGLFFAPLPYRQADRLVMVWEQVHGERRGSHGRNYVDWKRQATAFTDINAWGGRTVNLATADRPENVTAGTRDARFLAMLGYGHPLALGRTLHRGRRHRRARQGRHPDLSALAGPLRRRSRNPGPPGSHRRRAPHRRRRARRAALPIDQQNKVWLPLAFTDQELQSGNNSLLVMARLKDDVGLAEANAQHGGIGRHDRARTLRRRATAGR